MICYCFCLNFVFDTSGPVAGPRSLRVLVLIVPNVAFFLLYLFVIATDAGFNKNDGYGYAYG